MLIFCQRHRYRPLSYQWRKDGSTLAGQTTSTLALLSVKTNDAGAMRVVISNVAGSVTSAPPAAILTVNVPPSVTSTPQSRAVVAGAIANFSIGAWRAPLSYQWRKNGLTLSGQTNTSLTFLSVSTNDARQLRCDCQQRGGQCDQCAASHFDSKRATIRRDAPQSQTVVAGAIANFQSVPAALPPELPMA